MSALDLHSLSPDEQDAWWIFRFAFYRGGKVFFHGDEFTTGGADPPNVFVGLKWKRTREDTHVLVPRDQGDRPDFSHAYRRLPPWSRVRAA